MISQNVQLIKQITLIIAGSLLTVSFGTMVGWPSVTFPFLVNPEMSPILISWDDSAVLAGALMIGFIVGTAFSTITIYGSKTGIIISLCCQITGWTVLFCAHTIIEIGISRALVGLGNGFGSQQLRNYAKRSCNSSVFQLLMKYMPLAINVGVIFVYSVGSVVTFRVLSLICLTIPILALVLFSALPKNVESSCKEQIETIYQGRQSFGDNKDKKTVNLELKQLSFIEAFKQKNIRNNFLWLFFLISLPQYTGGTANIVYSQIIHTIGLNHYPKICSIFYASVFLLSNIIALMYIKKYYRRPVLLGSCIICSILLTFISCYFYFMYELLEVSRFFTWSPLCLLLLYNFFHTAGLNIIPILFISDKFPKNVTIVASKFYIMYSSLSGIISTKIFQVLFTYHGMHVAYGYLAAVGFVGFFVIFFFVKETKCKEILEEKICMTETSTDHGTVNTNQNNLEKCKTVVKQNDVILENEVITRRL